MAVTQKQIAQELGISHQLVSFALNGNGAVSEQRRREILEAAQEMGYRRNELARAMVTGKSHIIGLVSYGESTEHIATMISGALDSAVKAGYAVKAIHVPFEGSIEELREIAHRSTAWQLDGLVGVTLKKDAIAVFSQEFEKRGCPIAYVENTHKPEDIVVRSDDRSAFRAAIGYLVELGHRRLVHISGPDYPLTQWRNAIFVETLSEFGLPVDEKSLIPTHSLNWADVHTTEAATLELLGRPNRPTAVIANGDAAAMVVLRTTRKQGLKVPEDLSVIGFGNSALGGYADPPLTTIAQPFRDMGCMAMQRLIDHINAQSSVASAIKADNLEELPARLIVRESTAPPAEI